MKTPGFWYAAQPALAEQALTAALTPFSYVFSALARLRKVGAHPYRAHVPVICVGNAVAGGAGKTPTALALAQALSARGERPVFVTRGYGGRGGKGHDVRCVDPARDTAATVGDEALLLAACAPTWVGCDRAAAIRKAEGQGNVVIMDDGLQNPHVAPSAALLVLDGEAGIGNGRILPAGPLREPLAAAAAKACAAVIVGADRHGLGAWLAKHFNLPVFNAFLRPVLPPGFPHEARFIAFAGIGRPEKFYATAQELGCPVLETCDFPDHHPFAESELDFLYKRAASMGARLLTTEKDAVRLPPAWRDKVTVLPVELVFNETSGRGVEDLACLCLRKRA